MAVTYLDGLKYAYRERGCRRPRGRALTRLIRRQQIASRWKVVFPNSYQRWSSWDRMLAIRMAKNGASLAAIADEYGRSPTAIAVMLQVHSTARYNERNQLTLDGRILKWSD